MKICNDLEALHANIGKITLYFFVRVEPSLQMLLEKIIKRMEIAALPVRLIPFGTIRTHSRFRKIAHTWSHSTKGIYVVVFSRCAMAQIYK